MDVYEATKIVLSKIQTLDPENASKIMGLLLIQDHGEKEMIRLAFGPEILIHSIVLKARQQLSISKNPDLFYRTWPETHRRSFSVEESDDLSGFGWKPCLYYARGYCKNGTSCRFLHGDIIGDSAGAGDPFPQSPSSLANFILHQQQEDSPRGEEMNIFGRNRGFDLAAINGGSRIMNPVSRQIYLTFPAESSFREEDVSIYFSIYGPVQDVRIPYQQKRMFGFVTFLYPETVKLILAKGNPHFVCDSRVLVKPYKEKGKINLDKLRSPTGFDSRDPFDIPIGPRMFSNSQELLWRRKLEEEEAIEIQAKRLMGFHFLDVKSQNHHRTVSAGAGAGAGLSSPTSHFCSPRVSFYSDQLNQKVIQMNCFTPSMADEKSLTITTSHEEIESPKSISSLEHNLPDSPFASPKASSGAGDYFTAFLEEEAAAATAPVENNTSISGSLVISSSFIPANSQAQLMAFPSTKKVVFW